MFLWRKKYYLFAIILLCAGTWTHSGSYASPITKPLPYTPGPPPLPGGG